MTLNINHKELKAIFLTIQVFAERLRNTKIRIFLRQEDRSFYPSAEWFSHLNISSQNFDSNFGNSNVYKQHNRSIPYKGTEQGFSGFSIEGTSLNVFRIRIIQQIILKSLHTVLINSGNRLVCKKVFKETSNLFVFSSRWTSLQVRCILLQRERSQCISSSQFKQQDLIQMEKHNPKRNITSHSTELADSSMVWNSPSDEKRHLSIHIQDQDLFVKTKKGLVSASHGKLHLTGYLL